MKKRLSLFMVATILLSFLVLTVSCKKDESVDPSLSNPNKYVNNWIHEQMTIYYYWENKLPKSPNFSLAPTDFFGTLLNKFDKNTNPDGDRFSWIQENYVDLLNALSGVSSNEIGFEYVRYSISPDNVTPKQYYLLVLYPKLNTDAYAKGVKRGRFIAKIDNQDITDNNIHSLVSGTGTKELTFTDRIYNNEEKRYEFKLSPNKITIQTHKNFAENPIYLDSVYTINDKKIGYLVYNFFAKDKGDETYAYDKQLMNTLEGIKSKGASEFVLDLRYNGGGAVSSAIALASALVKNRSTQNLIMTTEYNATLSNYFKKRYGDEYNKDYFTDKVVKISYDESGKEAGRSDIASVPALNLSRLHVLTSRWTASASELIINGLKPYMDVITIGETTVGKNVGSFTLFEKEDPKNKWGMQPITFRYFNSNGKSDFYTGFVPDHEINILENMVSFGETEDPYLNKALSLITGASVAPNARMAKENLDSGLRIENNSASMKITEMYDDRRQEAIKKLIEK
ncbi:MAG: S41 family peptidase [Bacteroidia bacterium]|nr:S41 family peptidase [Bacteroidia bacterium]